MARRGQCFSTSTDTITVVPEETGIEFADIQDVEITAADQTYTFSDGVGRISSNVAKKVSTNSELLTSLLCREYYISIYISVVKNNKQFVTYITLTCDNLSFQGITSYQQEAPPKCVPDSFCRIQRRPNHRSENTG